MKARQTFTLIELLVVIAVIAVLLSLLLPALGRAKRESLRASCINNLKQISQAAMSYTESNGGYYPMCASGGQSWDDFLSDDLQTGLSMADRTQNILSNAAFAGRLKVLACPEDTKRSTLTWFPRSYSVNSGDAWWSPASFTGISMEASARSANIAAVAVLSNTLLIGERVNVDSYVGGTSFSTSGHQVNNNGAATHPRPSYYTYSFCDGHVEYAHASTLLTKRNR